MKKLGKTLAVLLAVLVSLSALGMTAFAADKSELRFNDDGKFTILNMTDIHAKYPLVKITRDYIRDTLKKVQPDLVILSGDNISGNACKTKVLTKAAIDEYMSVFEDFGAPVAIVFGNHDDENNAADKLTQIGYYKNYSCFIGEAGEPELRGAGTYNLPIRSSDGSRYAFNLWLTDSGTYNTENELGGYDCVRKEQIEWYKRTAAALAAENGGEVVPAMNFQHIVVPEIFEAVTKDENGKWVLPEGSDGEINETPCPPRYSNGQFDAFLEVGDVMATYSGHDHINSYRVNYKGIDIINTPGMGFGTYNNHEVGSRVIVLDENAPRDYETYCLSYFDVYSENDAFAAARYELHSRESSDKVKFTAFFKLIFAFFFQRFGFSGEC